MSEEKTIKGILGQLAGAASLCWDEPSLGIFDSVRAIQFVEEAHKEIEGILSKERAKLALLEKQNSVMKTALEFYADCDALYEVFEPPLMWNSFKEGGLPKIEDYTQILDFGDTARQALAGLKEKGE